MDRRSAAPGRDHPAASDGTRIDGTRTDWARRAVVLLAALSAVSYFSWPIGYLVNKAVVSGGLVSDLEVAGQPWSWLFVDLDIVSGLAGICAVALAYRSPAGRRWRFGGLVGFGIFSATTAASAIVPLHCGVGMAALLACGTRANRYGIHDLLSLFGYLSLFASLAPAMYRAARAGLGRVANLFTLLLGVIWSVVGIALATAVLVHASQSGLQHWFLGLTSAEILWHPLVVLRVVVADSGPKEAPGALIAE